MTKRRAILVRIAIAALISLPLGYAAFVTWQAFTPTHRITTANFGRIRAGMTREEVEAVFGVPPGNYCHTDFSDVIDPVNRLADALYPELRSETWWSDEGGAIVTFGADGTVVGMQLVQTRFSKPSLLERFRAWLGI